MPNNLIPFTKTFLLILEFQILNIISVWNQSRGAWVCICWHLVVTHVLPSKTSSRCSELLSEWINRSLRTTTTNHLPPQPVHLRLHHFLILHQPGRSRIDGREMIWNKHVSASQNSLLWHKREMINRCRSEGGREATNYDQEISAILRLILAS